MSLLYFLLSLGFMSHIDFQKCSCFRDEFRGRPPIQSPVKRGRPVTTFLTDLTDQTSMPYACVNVWTYYAKSSGMEQTERVTYRGH